MNTLDLDTLVKFTAQAQKLQAIAREIMPLVEAMRELDGKAIIPTDRLIRAGEAAQILGVSKSAIGSFVKAGLLTPLYVNSAQKKFWLSEVKALPRKKPWSIPNDLHADPKEKFLARVKELEFAQEDNLGDDKENTRQGGGDDYE